LSLLTFAGFLFGLVSGGINNTEAVWGATDWWPTVEMQARCVTWQCNSLVQLLCFVQLCSVTW